MTESTL